MLHKALPVVFTAIVIAASAQLSLRSDQTTDVKNAMGAVGLQHTATILR